jgi:hypothetical protein
MSQAVPNIPEVLYGNWYSVIDANKVTSKAINKLSTFLLGSNSVPVFGTLTLQDLTASRLIYADADKKLSSVTSLSSWVAGTANEIDIADDGDGTITVGIVNPLIVSKGGTGVATLTDHGILLGSGTDAITPLGVATNGQLPIGSTGADPVLATLTEGTGITIVNGVGSITISSSDGEVVHNNLGGLQGGTVDEYYHLTSAQVSALHDAMTLGVSADTLLGLTGQELSLDTQTSAYVLAGPTTGAPAVPTFRALAATDIPALAYEASGAIATHAALTTGVHGLAITAGQTLTVTTGGTLGSAAYTASTDYQPIDADLTAIAALANTDSNFIVGSGATWVAESGATARTSIGLGTGDSPQFAGLTVTDGTNPFTVVPATSVVTLSGQASTIAQSPRIQANFNGDSDSAFSLVAYSHDNVALAFDTWHDGTRWVSSDVGSNFILYKTGDEMRVMYNSGSLKGNTIASFNIGFRFSVTGGLVVPDRIQSKSFHIGSAPTFTDRLFEASGTHFGTGTTLFGGVIGLTFPATTTANGYGLYIQGATAAAAFTLTNAYAIRAFATTVGAGSTITNNWCIYATGNNYFAGDTTVTGTLRANTLFNFNGTNGVTQAAAAGTVCDVTALGGGIATAQTQITYAANGTYNFDATSGKVSSITITNGRITAITTAP